MLVSVSALELSVQVTLHPVLSTRVPAALQAGDQARSGEELLDLAAVGSVIARLLRPAAEMRGAEPMLSSVTFTGANRQGVEASVGATPADAIVRFLAAHDPAPDRWSLTVTEQSCELAGELCVSIGGATAYAAYGAPTATAETIVSGRRLEGAHLARLRQMLELLSDPNPADPQIAAVQATLASREAVGKVLN